MTLLRSSVCLVALALSAPAFAAGTALERGLATIEVPEIRADIFFFADAEMRGRDTPSQEQRVAARFLRARLERLGLSPGNGASFLYEYQAYQNRIDPERSRLTLTGPGGTRVLAFASDYFVPSSSDLEVLDLEAGAVWCGTGERKDLERPEVRGRWAVCLASDASARRRARYAEEAGAVGLLVLPDPSGSEDPAREQCERTTSYALNGLTAQHAPEKAKTFLPQVFLSLTSARSLFASAGLTAAPGVGTELALRVHDERAGTGPLPLEDVCALWPGSDPELAKEVLIVSAHYDHVGVKGGVVYPGADDNGSGSMGLLALAEALTEYGPMRRSVLLMWVSGEEKGLWGSAAWTLAPSLPPGTRAVCDINIDMIGRNAPDYLLITPTRKNPEYNGLTRLAEQLASSEGIAALGSADEYWDRSDHMNFARNLGIPVAFLFSDVHEDYHRPGDVPEKIDCDKIRRVTRLVLRMLDGLQDDVLKLR